MRSRSRSSWLCKSSSKNEFVKIVHPGGHVELHDRPILAAELLDRNPKCCVAHPTVFQQPHAVVSPETTLLLGRKYYVVPLGTIRKLRHAAALHPRPISKGDRRSSCWLFRNGEEREKSGGLESDSSETANIVRREGAAAGAGNGGSSSSPGRISLLSMDNWQPGLHSVCEEY